MSADLLGWTGIGQGNTRIAPVTMLRVVSAIANGGNAPSFNLVQSLANQTGKSLKITLPHNQSSLMPQEVADTMKKMMRYNVTEHYGEYIIQGI